MRKIFKRIAWLVACLITISYGLLWIFYIPSTFDSDFGRGVFYPFAVMLGVGHFLMAGTFFWYEVVKGGK